jgi:hypothetical protein
MEKWYLLKLSQEWGADKGEWWRAWIQVWYTWYMVKTLCNHNVPPHNTAIKINLKKSIPDKSMLLAKPQMNQL